MAGMGDREVIMLTYLMSKKMKGSLKQLSGKE